MQQEIEAKFLDLSHDEIRSRLNGAGAHLEQPMRIMRRALFDYPDGRLQKQNWGRLRVRDEGDKVTVTYKSGGSDEYSQEVETTVGSFDTMIELLKTIGLEQYSYQESKRETWKMGDVEVVLDEWPWLNPYIEIEGPSEKVIQLVAQQLNLDWIDAKFGNVDTAYRAQYAGIKEDETIGVLAEVKFADALPDWLKERQ